ncbi:possible translation initiation factor [Xanthomonas phage Xp15]|uniref:Possible translation initiation factor n=1 Tax=Xanthomonas phage Xp15 TaxID=322855 RepID=Q52PR6_9CAUD|nr:possible translation initiation factor [Xanthomonas phage Xp15]AAX84892.1 possible translation initiation factor [Xanthomonas phage Xp15]
MSIFQNLLANYPKYSARKVRRLAEHLEFLSGSADYPVSRQIAEDLQAYHLLQAKMESQMNDDVQVQVQVTGPHEHTTEHISVTPVGTARKALDVIHDFIRINIPSIHWNNDKYEKVRASANGYINGQSFYTDRTIIQARLSPQNDLPLDGAGK